MVRVVESLSLSLLDGLAVPTDRFPIRQRKLLRAVVARLLDDLVWTQSVHDVFALGARVARDDEELVGALSDLLPLSG